MIRALASCGRQDRRFSLRALPRGRRSASLMPDLLWLADFVGLAGSAPAFQKSIATASLLGVSVHTSARAAALLEILTAVRCDPNVANGGKPAIRRHVNSGDAQSCVVGLI